VENRDRRSLGRGPGVAGRGPEPPNRRPATARSGRRALTRQNLGFQLAKASQRWNELLAQGFSARGFREVRPSFGSVLVPLFEEDGLRMTELAQRSRLAKQTMTTMVELVERAGFVRRRADPDDGRAKRVYLTAKGKRLQPIALETVAEIDALVTAELGERSIAALSRTLDLLADLGRTDQVRSGSQSFGQKP
jgi:DNA-binding MarR family transcriptional regulator